MSESSEDAAMDALKDRAVSFGRLAYAIRHGRNTDAVRIFEHALNAAETRALQRAWDAADAHNDHACFGGSQCGQPVCQAVHAIAALFPSEAPKPSVSTEGESK